MVLGETPQQHVGFELWLAEEGAKCSAALKELICKYKELFKDDLPFGLPPQRVIDHTITLMPGQLLKKGVIYKLGKDELEAQRAVLMKLKDHKWISMTCSPFAAPAMMVGKKKDSSGVKQYRMVVNYQELNFLTISPEYPLPTIQEVLDSLHGAKISTTMNMEQGFHQI